MRQRPGVMGWAEDVRISPIQHWPDGQRCGRVLRAMMLDACQVFRAAMLAGAGMALAAICYALIPWLYG